MSSESSKPFIISIDDEVNILKLIETVLERDFEVDTFSDSQAALASLAEGSKPDLIICDINMPGLDGFELHEQVRNLPSLRGVPFVYLTALGDRDTFRKGMQQGADDYLTKPFTSSELKEAVAARLERVDTLRSSDETNLLIRTLNGANVSFRNESIQYEAKKVIELLLCLIVNGNAARLSTLRRELWQKEASENTIHVLINRARKAFVDVAQFTFEDESIKLELKTPYAWDAEDFENSAKEAIRSSAYADIERAIGLYRGTFLPGFNAPWTEQQRSHYDSMYLSLLELSAEVAPNEASRKTAQTRLEAFLGA